MPSQNQDRAFSGPSAVVREDSNPRNATRRNPRRRARRNGHQNDDSVINNAGGENASSANAGQSKDKHTDTQTVGGSSNSLKENSLRIELWPPSLTWHAVEANHAKNGDLNRGGSQGNPKRDT